jgi:excisionase family DNA binding protein
MGDVLTVKQAAKYLQINPQTISRKLQHGILPGRKVGKSYRIRKEDLDEYLKGPPHLASNPQDEPTLLPLPEGYEALRDKVWRALGYPDGYTWENYVDHTQKHGRDAFRLELQQERLLPPEEQELLMEGIRLESENLHRKAIAAFARKPKTKEELEGASAVRPPRTPS